MRDGAITFSDLVDRLTVLRVASAADEGTTDFWFLASDRSQLAEDAQAQL
jgi:hypothetical protein